MPKYRRTLIPGGTYFFTAVTYRQYPVFADHVAADLLTECFALVKAVYPLNIDAMVILPDHVHCIWTLPDDDSDYSRRWKEVKTRFTRAYAGATANPPASSIRRRRERGIWQRRFWEDLMMDEEDFIKHCDYIQYNPVKHGVAGRPADWRYSTFGDFVAEGL